MLSRVQEGNGLSFLSKPFKIFILIGGLVVLGFFIASCSNKPQFSVPSENTAQIQSPISGWLIYKNSPLGYEISYPPDWRLGESMSMGYPYVTLSSPVIQAKSSEGSEVERSASLEISAEEFRAVVPANEYLRNFARTDRGPDGRWLDVETEESPSNVWGFEGYYLVSRSGAILQHTHGALVPYPKGSLLIQIRLTILDSKSVNADAYVETFNQILASLKFAPPDKLPEPDFTASP